MALSSKNAAIYIPDKEIKRDIIKTLFSLLKNEEKQKELSDNIKKLAIKNSAQIIVDEIFKIIK